MDVTHTRTRNITTLVNEAGGPTAFGKLIDRDQVQVSQWTSVKKPKAIGGRLARDIEKRLGYDAGWLDRPQWESAEPEPAGYSQLVRLDHDIVRGVARAMQDAAEALGVTLGIREAVEISAELYERVSSSLIATADVVWLTKRLEQGATRNEAGGDISDGAADAAGKMGRSGAKTGATHRRR